MITLRQINTQLRKAGLVMVISIPTTKEGKVSKDLKKPIRFWIETVQSFDRRCKKYPGKVRRIRPIK